MKRIHFLLALSASLLIAGYSFGLQGRGQGRTGAPSTPGVNANPGGNAGGGGPSKANPAGNPGGGNPGGGNPGGGNPGGGHPGNSNAGDNHSAGGNHPANPRSGASAPDSQGFKNHGQYVAAKHVSENLGIPLEDLRSKMTRQHPESLGQAIQELKGLPPAAANAEAKNAEQQSKNEGKKK